MEFISSSSTMELDLPSYVSSSPLPSYSCELANGERSLQQTPRSRSRPSPTSLFIKKAGKTTIILNEQEHDATLPTYGRRALISGSILLEKSENVLDIVLKIEGKLDTTISDGGGQSIKMIADSYTLWSHSTSQGSPCLSQVAFSVLMPSTFKHNGENVSLPPSYNVAHYDVPSLFVRSSYQIHVIVTRLRHQKVGNVWPKTKHILIPFNYLPRTRPHRPIVSTKYFFLSIKETPEEWYQAVTFLKTRSPSTIGSISAHLFVPSCRIYGLSDKIPFHVQLSGDLCSLRELISGAMLDRVMSVDSHNTADMGIERPSSPKRPFLQVKLLRQVTVTLRDKTTSKNVTMSEACIYPVPPDSMSWYSPPDEECQETHIDWEGELSLDDEKITAGFMAANVQVKDFISLTLSPPNALFLQVQLNIPVKLVTDPFNETPGHETSLEPSA